MAVPLEEGCDVVEAVGLQLENRSKKLKNVFSGRRLHGGRGGEEHQRWH